MKTLNISAIALATLLMATSCGNKESEWDASGVFETTEVIVSAQAAGEIMQFNVEEGQQVTAGTQLGYIDHQQSVLKKDQLAATRQSTDNKKLDASRQVASIKQQIANQQRELNRYRDLLKHDAATQKQVDDIDYNIKVLRQQLAAAQEQVESNNKSLADQSTSINSQVAQLDDAISHTIIKSPIDGIILTKYAEPGEYATPGKALFKVSNVTDMKLRAYITADQLTAVKLGQEVTVKADSGKDGSKAYKGTISWIADKAEFTPKTIQTRDERANLVYAIKISVKNDGLIKRGMYGDVKF